MVVQSVILLRQIDLQREHEEGRFGRFLLLGIGTR